MIIIPTAFYTEPVKQYWDSLPDKYFKDRFYGIESSKESILEDYYKNNLQKYMVLDDKVGSYIAEFALEKYSGKVYKIHTSLAEMHPIKKVRVGKYVINYLLKDFKNALGSNYISALVGTTPVFNTSMLRFLQILGFKIIYTLPKADTYNNKYIDIVVSVKEV